MDWLTLHQPNDDSSEIFQVQVMLISRRRNAISESLKQLNNTEITLQSSVKLLAVTIDNQLKFDQGLQISRMSTKRTI